MALYYFYFDYFEDMHIDFSLQSVLYSSTRTLLITFLLDEYRWIFLGKLNGIYRFEGRGHNSDTASSGDIRARLIQECQI